MLLPEILAEECGPLTATLQLHLPRELLIFEGHFDEHPIVPGIAEVDWAMRFAATRLPVAGAFCGMGKVKFMRVIQPLARLTLKLDWQPQKLRFEFHDARGACSQGELLFTAA